MCEECGGTEGLIYTVDDLTACKTLDKRLRLYFNNIAVVFFLNVWAGHEEWMMSEWGIDDNDHAG